MASNLIPARVLGCLFPAAFLLMPATAHSQTKPLGAPAAPLPRSTAAASPDIADIDCKSATLTLTGPNGGETWVAGTTRSITWAASGLAEIHGVSIRLCRSGQVWAWLGSGRVTAGRFDWTVCSSLENGDGYTIRISGYDECWNEVSDESDQPFTITGASGPATLTVTSPTGGGTWGAGSTLPIRWTATNLEGTAQISLRKGGYDVIWLGEASVALGRFDWTVCPSIWDGTDYTVRVLCGDGCGREVIDESDVAFGLTGIADSHPMLTVTSPRAGQTYQAGGPLEVTWTSANLVGYVNVSLLKGGERWQSFEAVPVSMGELHAMLCPSIGDGADYTIELWGYDACGQGVCAEGDGPFLITGSDPPPTVTVTSPKGGEVWPAGSTQTITWTGTRLAGDVSIYLVSDRTGSLYLGSTPASAGRFDWTVCTAIGDGIDYTIEVHAHDACDHSCEDRSDGPHSIIGSTGGPSSLTLASPNGGETWTAGTVHRIMWTATNLDGYVSIGLVKGGQDPVAIAIDSVPASAGQYDWQVCSALGNGTEFTVSIWGRDICGRYLEDESDALFSITGSEGPATLTLTSPNGGEVWPAGSTQTVTWMARALGGTVDAFLYRDGEYIGWIGSAPASSGRLDWTVCHSVGNGDHFSIELRGNDDCASFVQIQDMSDGPFSITGSDGPSALTVTSPNAGETWAVGTTQTVAWIGWLLAGNAQISLYKDGQSVMWLGTVPASAGRFDWQVCSAIVSGTGYTIRVASQDDCGDYVEDAGDVPFTITGGSDVPASLTITSPNGGETWTAGTTQTITWRAPNITENVHLALCREQDGELFWLGSASASAGRLDAWICSAIRNDTDYRLFIYGRDDCGRGHNDYSDGTIAIMGSIGSAKLVLTSPNGGEVWPVGSTHTIKWTSENLTGVVEVVLRRAGGMYPLYLGSADVSDGSFTWTIDPSVEAGGDFTIRLDAQDACGYSVYDSSDSAFTISPRVRGDLDQDTDTDLQDFQYFSACFNGPDRPPKADTCADADFDGDTDVDLADFLAFQDCLNGPNRPPKCG
ncbi:MAG: Ser-Thr-rich GPI-anchored membrane family protein [Phycisphaerae bacterium]